MKLRVHAAVEVARPPEEVFDFAVDCRSLPVLLRRVAPIPGIASAEMVSGSAPGAGARRRVAMTDSSWILEEIVTFDRPLRHRYRWLTLPAMPFCLLVRGGEGDWTFSPTPSGTRVDWTYTFELTTALALPLALPVLTLFQRWMRRSLAHLPEEMPAQGREGAASAP
ncbi:MAG TPA: SRPBCC family protein [Anaeromyxobacteraceae bacterium]|nr:SRPBCC family protein [Anaeromyxobacteraceae bacterium]